MVKKRGAENAISVGYGTRQFRSLAIGRVASGADAGGPDGSSPPPCPAAWVAMTPDLGVTVRWRMVGRGARSLVMPEMLALADVMYLFWLSGDASSLEVKVSLTPRPASSAHTYLHASMICARYSTHVSEKRHPQTRERNSIGSPLAQRMTNGSLKMTRCRTDHVHARTSSRCIR